jgi:DNA-binding NtrC family response regulator
LNTAGAGFALVEREIDSGAWESSTSSGLSRSRTKKLAMGDAMWQTTVLVVDHEPLTRWAIGERLRAEGYEVLEAGDGLTALLLVERVAIVLLDATLPDVNGVPLVGRLVERNPNARIIVMTADTGLESPGEALKHSGFPRASKPFLLDEIVALVKRMTLEVFPRAGGNLRTV